MATNYIATSNPYAKIRVDTSASLVGSWPNVKYRISWNMRYYCSGGYFISSVENGIKFWFHQTEVIANVNYYLTPGQSSPIYASGTLDLPLGNARGAKHSPGCGVNNGLYPGNATVATGQLNIPTTGTLAGYVNGVTHNSVTLNLTKGNNSYNYWTTRIYYKASNASSYTLFSSDVGNGNTTVTGLSPGVAYNFHIELWGRDGSRMSTQQLVLNASTNGISYIEKDTSFDIGSVIKIPITTYSDSFTHTFELRQGNTVLKTLSFSSSSLKYTTNFSLTAAQNTALYNAIPNALSLNLTATVTTYSNGVLVGSNSRIVTMTVNKTSNAPSLTGFSYKDMHPNSIAKTGNNQWIIQNVSYLQISSIIASAKNGASIARYELSVSDQVISSTSSTITTTTITKQTQMVLTVIDSRGLQKQYTKTYAKWIPYTPPIISLFNMLRVNGVEESTYLVTNGTFDRLNINGVDKNPNLTLKFRYKLTTASTWGGWVQQAITISGSSFSYNNIVGLFDSDKNYDVQLEIGDYFGASYALTQLVKAQPELSIRENQVGIGAVPDASVNAALQVKGNITQNGRMVIDYVITKSW
ncbi:MULTISPECIES: DUF859 family phage minor structural protein [unclassified Breznakia]|uniref:DUF859 family phage minor structural protein n=1 Tax=unclassified Breznakia TaxID=2623764 RepID=UPI0024746602|nr:MULTISPECIES: DUF859 family phage minor structural protein [unclassified Breznakia]MDH6367563.1 hypothetical protein [Breznakia sp. PH1-1]MDH6404643.1 hypothetical protein [Breznakia sp. PF1-11]MDH6412393.1 hypothetical protein [Breznakia sp. PFB1-11]MDH6414731.1 hypothetical protein [Breznakia sp. PFB1-14]MDH6417024.1 hypothetical protein [Breznakia sp. PFB1-4]